MTIDMQTSRILLNSQEEDCSESYPFKMMYDVQEADVNVNDGQFSTQLGPEFKTNFFKVKIKPNFEKLVSAGNVTNKNQWIRVLLLIIQMNRLQIDFTKVNPFVFEKFQKR